MKKYIFALVSVFLLLFVGNAFATVSVSPSTVIVGGSSSSSFFASYGHFSSATFLDDFTSTEDPKFCTNFQSSSLGCLSSSVLGTLSGSNNNGYTSSAVSSLTETVQVPFNIIQQANELIQSGQATNLFYVRRLDPSPASTGNIIGTPGQQAYLAVTLKITSSTAGRPISLSRVFIYGQENGSGRISRINLTEKNIRNGRIQADINYGGSGVLSGWWEVRMPGDPGVRDIDRFTQASLTDEDRFRQRRFQKVKRFWVMLPPSGRVILKGPQYLELPQMVSGQMEVLLRIDLARDPRAAIGTSGGGSSLGLVGATAPFPLETLKVFSPGRLALAPQSKKTLNTPLQSRLVIDKTAAGNINRVSVAWDKVNGTSLVVMVLARNKQTGEVRRIIAPVEKGFVVLPPEWNTSTSLEKVTIQLSVLGPDRQEIVKAKQLGVFKR